jgi:hypothetical protein
MVISEVLIGLLKGIYSPARPIGPLVVTSGAGYSRSIIADLRGRQGLTPQSLKRHN